MDDSLRSGRRAPAGVAPGDRALRVDVLGVLQDDQAFLDDVPIGGLQHRQRRRAAGLVQQPIGPLPGDVDHPKVDFVSPSLQRQPAVRPLAERTDGDVVEGRVNDGCGGMRRPFAFPWT
jgi:hypothetical protein